MKIKAGCIGFTLIEVMVLLTVIGFLLIIATPDQTESSSHNRKSLAKAFYSKFLPIKQNIFGNTGNTP